MNKTVWLSSLILISVFPILSALCEEGQIDINTASAEELDKLSGIGPAKAKAIINARPFNSTDSLIDVIGIGEATLENIKSQGLACVDKESENQDETDIEKGGETNEEIGNKKIEDVVKKTEPPIVSEETIQEESVYVEPAVIKLNSKDIKGNNDTGNSSKTNYAIYGFFGFCVLIVVLFLLRRNSFKNEFR